MSSSGSTDQPKKGEIKALMAFGKSDQGIEEKGDKEKAERMLTAMKKLEEENKRLLEEIRKEIENKETYKEAFKDTMNELKQYRSDYPKKK